MKDIDHKISREIVNTAKKHKAKVIKLERLENIRSTTRTSRKNNPSLHTWSFYRLAQYIEYKAKLAGIEVEYVDPACTGKNVFNVEISTMQKIESIFVNVDIIHIEIC